MEKPLQQHLYPSVPLSPFNVSSNSRQSLCGSPAGGRKSAIPNKLGGQSVSGKSNQSALFIQSEFSVVESYGFQLPVLVSEALTFNEKKQGISVMCSQNGWAWLVIGRRLLIWQYKDLRSNVNKESLQTIQRRGGAMAQCRELSLPHCDLGQKASLVSVFQREGQQMASCVSVSPTGDVRYWPSIAHDGSSVDVTVILDGQEFDRLLDLPHHEGYMIVTTTCSLVYLQLKLVNGRHVVQHKTLRPPTGLLGSISRRFSSIIIGSSSSNDKESKFVSIDCEASSDCKAVITVLSDRWLQLWSIDNNDANEQLLFEDSDIIREIREQFQQKFWNSRENNDVQLHLLDLHNADGKTFVLAGAVNLAHTPQMYYSIAVLSPATNCINLLHFYPLKFTQFFSSSTEKECLSLRFIICRTYFYLYTDRIVYSINLCNSSVTEVDIEKIEFQMQDDRILSAAVCGNIPLFFSCIHGLVCITPGDFDAADASVWRNSLVNAENTIREQSLNVATEGDNYLRMFDLDPDAMYNELNDDGTQLKAAFIYRLKGNIQMCNTILNDFFQSIAERLPVSLTDVGHLDKIIVSIAEELVEDIPAADPRWEELYVSNNSNKHALGSSSSLQIEMQLKEKNLTMRHFVEFLRATGIWEKLKDFSVYGSNILKSTCHVLCDINEKIIAAMAFKAAQTKFPRLIEEAIKNVIQTWNENPEGNLTVQDLFYVRICKIQDMFQAIADIAELRIGSNPQSALTAADISDLNTIVLSVLTEVIDYREKNSSFFAIPTEMSDFYEFMPWTAMSGNVGVRDALSRLVDYSVRYGARYTSDPGLKQKLYQQIMEIIDFILDGRKRYLDSVRDPDKYNVLLQQFESQRRDLISPLVEDGQFELSLKLAEKYHDFQSLLTICDKTKDQERLDSYIEKFEEYDFAQFAINWHLRQNRQGEVFERFKTNQAALSQFMRNHPTLGWIQLLFNGDFERAAKILLELAQNEVENMQRKKSMLSLAKLACFSAADSNISLQMETINTELLLLIYQESLSIDLLLSFGYDLENQKVLKPEEIINLFICEENEGATEMDFRKAVELLNFLEEPNEARHKIWCAAILRDDWVNYDVNSAVDYLQNLMFVKLIEICHLMDADFESSLPPIEDFINSSELGDLVHNNQFKYLLKLTYEFVSNSFTNFGSR